MTEWSVRREGMTTQTPRVTRSGSDVPNMLGLPTRAMKIAIIGASGKLGQYMVEEALARGHEVTAVCREERLDLQVAHVELHLVVERIDGLRAQRGGHVIGRPEHERDCRGTEPLHRLMGLGVIDRDVYVGRSR